MARERKEMDKKQMFFMAVRIILPPAMVMLLFVIAIRVMIIPATEDALMDKKRETIQAIVQSATSIIERHATMVSEGLLSLEAAQEEALLVLRALRYGDEDKHYLWIQDTYPKMVMHPYFPEMEGVSLRDYEDPEGNLLFVDAVNITKENGDGFIHYMWPREDNLDEPIPKLSYVRLFKKWDWIVGSGIYLDDVQREIQAVIHNLAYFSTIVGILFFGLLSLIVWRGWRTEKQRRIAEKELFRSRERYQALARASGEMLLLSMNGIIVGANKQACDTLTMSEEDILNRNISEFVLDDAGKEMISKVSQGEEMETVETILGYGEKRTPVLLSAEHVTVHGTPAIMFGGYSLKSRQKTEEVEPIVQETIQKCDFAVLILTRNQSGKVVKANAKALDLFGLDQEEDLIGKTLRELFRKDDVARINIELEKDGHFSNLVVQGIAPYEDRYLRVWGSKFDESEIFQGQVALILFEDSAEIILSNVQSSMLAEFLSPTRHNTLIETQKAQNKEEADIKEHYVRSQIILRNCVKMGLRAEEITRAVITATDQVFERGVKKAIDQLGQPPCPYAFLALGSIGRMESTLNPDQDTAILFENNDEESKVNEHAPYFEKFGKIVTDYVATMGIPPCASGNSASNPQWCKSKKDWKDQYFDWILDSDPDAIIKVSIFFDFRVLSGDENLAQKLREYIFKEVKAKPIFLYRLAQDTIHFRPPTNLLGKIYSESQKEKYIDLKKMMLHFVNYARIYALKHKIHETNTLQRLKRLMKEGHITETDAQDAIDSWNFLLDLRLKTQVAALEKHFPKENALILNEITSWQDTMLKKAMAQINAMQKRLAAYEVGQIG
ncbi:MAG: cache domain-containing protein [Thermotogota bacterium]